MATGRPSIYSAKLVNKICKRIAAGESLLQICRDDDMPAHSTVHEWLLDDSKKVFSDKYARARELQAEYLFDEMIDIADNGSNDWEEREVGSGRMVRLPDHEHINRSRLRVDTRKFYISKVLPKKFGDKVDVTSGGEKVATVAPIIGMRIIDDAKEARTEGD